MFSYERSEGFVRYDSTVTTVDRIIETLRQQTGYGAMERTGQGTER